MQALSPFCEWSHSLAVFVVCRVLAAVMSVSVPVPVAHLAQPLWSGILFLFIQLFDILLGLLVLLVLGLLHLLGCVVGGLRGLLLDDAPSNNSYSRLNHGG